MKVCAAPAGFGLSCYSEPQCVDLALYSCSFWGRGGGGRKVLRWELHAGQSRLAYVRELLAGSRGPEVGRWPPWRGERTCVRPGAAAGEKRRAAAGGYARHGELHLGARCLCEYLRRPSAPREPRRFRRLDRASRNGVAEGGDRPRAARWPHGERAREMTSAKSYIEVAGCTRESAA
jgi:hypothetical protein